MAQNNQLGGNRRDHNKNSRSRKLTRNWIGIAAVLIIATAFSVSAIQNPGQSNGSQSGARNAGVKPKRTPVRRGKSSANKVSISSVSGVAESSIIDGTSPILAT